MKYLLYNYLGLSDDEIKNIKKLKSRFITILKQYPKVLIANQDCYVLVDEDSDTDSNSEVEKYMNQLKIAHKKRNKNNIN